MIYLILTIAFGVLAALALAGAWLKRNKRAVLLWAAGCAAVAAGAAYTHSFWPVPVFGLMALWAGFAALDVMTLSWRLRVGLTLYVVLGAAVAIFPTVHDELMCPDGAPIEELRHSCPAINAALDPEPRAELEEAAAAGDRGPVRFLTANIPFRMVRGLDLKGGLRLVYTVDVEEAIRDMRDRNYDDLRAALTKSFGLSEHDTPSVADMQKLSEHVTMKKPRSSAETIIAEFKDPAAAKQHVNDELLRPFSNELNVVRSQDGATITFTIKNEIESYTRERAVQQAKETILRRIDGLGVKEASVSVRDEDIIVEIPGSDEKDFQGIRDIISQTARLEFKLLDDEANFFEPFATADVPEGISFDIENAPVGPGKTQPNFYARIDKLPSETLDETLERFKKWTGSEEVRSRLDEDHEIGFGKYYRVDEDTEEYQPAGWRTYYLWSKAELTGDMVRDAQALSDQSDTGFGAWFVNMQLTPKGAEIFEEITEANVKKRFAIILDGKVESAPEIREKIGGGQARITMGAGGIQQQLEDARKLELVLRSGALPAPISPSNEQRLQATLGHDSIEQGLQAAFFGGLLVIVFMFMSYRQSGFIANFAVILNMFLQLAILSMLGASMTLPGIAGLALTVGMAVDANVLINERIKEELAAGKSARAAVSLGYDKAFTAIFDGNATTLITGLILAQFGSGPIKGFAVTLIIGMITNLFTGVLVTRLLYELWVKVRRDSKLGLA